MKAIITSDTHKNRKRINDVVKFANDNSIDTVFDAGDLHGEIDAFSGIKLLATYWRDAAGAMSPREFDYEVHSIDGTVVPRGSVVTEGNISAFMRHDLADYEKEIPEERLAHAKSEVDSQSENGQKKLVLFGHTHRMYFDTVDDVTVINPGWSNETGTFAVVDTETDTVVFRTIDEIIMTITPESEIEHFRMLDTKKYIARLKNGNEIFVYQENGEEKRTAEFNKILIAGNSDEGVQLKVRNENGLEQLLHPNFTSNEYNKIENWFFGNDDKGKLTNAIITGYVARKESGKSVLVVGPDQKESLEFDEIATTSTTSVDDLLLFIGRTRISDEEVETYNKDKIYTDSLVLDDTVIATYKTISNLKKKDDKIVLAVKKDDGSSCVAVYENGQIAEQQSYDEVAEINIIDDHVVYRGIKDDQTFVVLDGVEQEHHLVDKYPDGIRNMCMVNDILTYVFKQGESESLYHNGQKVAQVPAERYGSAIGSIKSVDGKLSYKTEGETSQIVIGDETTSIDGKVRNFDIIDGELIFSKPWEPGCFRKDGSKFGDYQSIAEAKGKV
jgi:predicted phosphodiesterase